MARPGGGRAGVTRLPSGIGIAFAGTCSGRAARDWHSIVTRRRHRAVWPALPRETIPGSLPTMSVEFAYRFREDVPRSSLRELEDVVLTVAVEGDDRLTIPAGAEGTIVSVYNGGEAYLVEFAEPEGTLASVARDEIRRVESAVP